MVKLETERKLWGLEKADTPILCEYQIFYNIVKPHEGLNGMTPAKKWGITIEGDNKWITLIQNASNRNQ